MPLPVDVRQMHTNNVPSLLVETKTLLNMLLMAARSDTLTVADRNIIDADGAGLWSQIVDIMNINRGAREKLEAEQDADSEETSAAIQETQAA